MYRMPTKRICRLSQMIWCWLKTNQAQACIVAEGTSTLVSLYESFMLSFKSTTKRNFKTGVSRSRLGRFWARHYYDFHPQLWSSCYWWCSGSTMAWCIQRLCSGSSYSNALRTVDYSVPCYQVILFLRWAYIIVLCLLHPVCCMGAENVTVAHALVVDQLRGTTAS